MVTLHPRGRKQIAVDQPQGGTRYPFVAPSNDLALLIGDLYLNYKDDSCELALPFKIAWLHGFGTDSATDPTGDVHDYDLLITDANDETVFDSRDADQYETVDWSDGDGVFLRIIEWVNTDDEEILRVVTYISWDEEDASAREWLEYFEPTNGVLDPRTLERIPPRLLEVAVVTDLADEGADIVLDSGQDIVLSGGYNARLSQLEDQEALINLDGGPFIRLIKLDLAAGLGLGRFPCDSELLLKQINGVGPNSRGNLTLDATDCYRISRPITVTGDREADVDEATLQIDNDCGPCCDCQDFINVYEAIRRLTDKYRELGQRAEAVRDQFRANKERWETGAECRRDNNIQVAAEAFPGCKVAIAVGLCNTTDSPMMNVTLGVSFDASLAGCVTCSSTSRTGNIVPGSGKGGYSTSYKLGGAWPDYTIDFDCISPGSMGTVQWVMWFENCSDSDTTNITVTGGRQPIVVEVSLQSDPETDCCVPSSSL